MKSTDTTYDQKASTARGRESQSISFCYQPCNKSSAARHPVHADGREGAGVRAPREAHDLARRESVRARVAGPVQHFEGASRSIKGG